MKVTTVSASVRFSGTLGDSRFKTIELSAEATVNGQETWQAAQASLYHQLGQQLKALWGQGNGQKAQETPTKPAEAPSEPEPVQNTPPPPPEHYCQDHQTEHKRHEKDGKVWYSHRLPNGKWCREK